MRKIITLIAVAALFAGACSRNGGGGGVLKTDLDSVAYIIGMNIGANLMQMDSTLNVNAVCDGIRDVFRKKTKFSTEEAKIYYLRYTAYMLPEKARALEEQFLADMAKSNRNFARTQSGVTYNVLVLGDQSQIPSSDRDSLSIRLTIRNMAGESVFSSYERGDTLRTTLGEMRRGVKESLKLIGKGGKINSWIPSSEAYGAEGNKEFGIQPNATLNFEIELVELDKYANWSQRANLRR